MSSASNSNGFSDESKQENEEYCFRSQVTPAFVCQLLREGKLTTSDLLLMWIIDSMVQTEWGGKRAVGCFMSNKYLAQATNTHPGYVSNRISHLCEMKLIVIVWRGHQRYLELEWSRTAAERDAMKDGTYKEALLDAYENQITNKGGSLKSSDVNRFTDSGKPEPPLQENLKHKYSSTKNSKNKIKSDASRPTVEKTISSSSSEELPITQSKSYIIAQELRTGLLKAKKLMRTPSLMNWKKEIDILVAEIKERDECSKKKAYITISDVLKDHLNNLRDYWQPKAYSAAAFRKDFIKIEDAMQRRKEGPPKKPVEFNKLRDDEIW